MAPVADRAAVFEDLAVKLFWKNGVSDPKELLMIRGLITGASYPFRTLGTFWRSPHLFRFLVIPICLNLFIGAALYIGLLIPAWQGIDHLATALSQQFETFIVDLPAWLALLEYPIAVVGWLLRVLVVLGLFLVTGFIFLQFGVLLGAPLYGQLSEHLEKFRTGRVEIVEVNIFQDLGRAVLFEVKKIVFWIAIALPLLLLNFLPGVGTAIAAVGWIALSATIICLDFLDGPSERRRFSFRRKVGIVLKGLPATASFSLACWGLISVPLLNLVTIPICVASGTLFWCDRVLPQLESIEH